MKKKIAIFALVALISALSPLSVFAAKKPKKSDPPPAPAEQPLTVEPTLTPTPEPVSTAPVRTDATLPLSEGRQAAWSREPAPQTDPTKGIPDWVIKPEVVDQILLGNGTFTERRDADNKVVIDRNGVLTGMGSAKAITYQKAIQLAESRARQDIAIQLDSKVQARIRDYTETRESGARQSDSSITSIAGSQATNISISNVKVEKREQSPDGTWWVLVTWRQAQETPSDDESYRERAMNEFNLMEGGVTPAAAATPTPATPVVITAPVAVTGVSAATVSPVGNSRDEQAAPAALKLHIVSE
ncbi:hypothetical protein AGMMS50267_18120 [Spirochaetia bacterium]|nr:hypothetical protein AGMMS50267_18120 [Spirochaetia bacterium]